MPAKKKKKRDIQFKLLTNTSTAKLDREEHVGK